MSCCVPAVLLVGTHLYAFLLIPAAMYVFYSKTDELQDKRARSPFVALLGLSFMMVRRGQLTAGQGWGKFFALIRDDLRGMVWGYGQLSYSTTCCKTPYDLWSCQDVKLDNFCISIQCLEHFLLC